MLTSEQLSEIRNYFSGPQSAGSRKAFQLLQHIAAQQAELDRLKSGKLTYEEIQNLCHNKGCCEAKEFYDGCHEHQRKLFGVSERDCEKEYVATLEECINTITARKQPEYEKLEMIIEQKSERIAELQREHDDISNQCAGQQIAMLEYEQRIAALERELELLRKLETRVLALNNKMLKIGGDELFRDMIDQLNEARGEG